MLPDGTPLSGNDAADQKALLDAALHQARIDETSAQMQSERGNAMSNPRLVRRAEWDGTFSLLLDGEVILERRPLAEIERRNAAQAVISLPRVKSVPTQLPDEYDPPTLRVTGYDDPPSLKLGLDSVNRCRVFCK